MRESYKMLNGVIYEFDEIIIPDNPNSTIINHHLYKVNIPFTQKDFMKGNGEGVWASFPLNAFKALLENKSNGIYFVKIMNDSVYYPSLTYGTIIPITVRGEYRPIAIYEEISHNYKRITEDEKEEIFKKIYRNR